MKQDFEEMKKQATEASGVLKIANETRLLILCSIIEDDFTVNQLSEKLEADSLPITTKGSIRTKY